MTTPDQRGTDKIFYKLMQLSGSAVLKLFGIPTKQAEKYTFRAIALKEVEFRPDIEGLPMLENSQHGRAYIEFQGYKDELIRQRLIANIALSCLQTAYHDAVTAAIIFTDTSYQKAALPVGTFNNQAFPTIHEIVLTKYTEQQLLDVDPRLLVLAPFTLEKYQKRDKTVLYAKAAQWRTQLKQAYPPQEYPDALNLVSLFLLNRCTKLSYEEVYNMFHFDLMTTQAGKDIHAIGKKEGIEEGVKTGMEKGVEKGEASMARKLLLSLLTIHFGDISASLQQQIHAIDSPVILNDLFEKAAKCQRLDEFEVFLNKLH